MSVLWGFLGGQQYTFWANGYFHFVLVVSGARQNQVTKALAIILVPCMEKSQAKLVHTQIDYNLMATKS